MESVVTLYEDRFGAILDRVAQGIVELRWYDATEDLSAEEFQEWLQRFAGEIGSCRRPGVLVDATRFLMDHALMDSAWRDEHVIPRYNAAGVKAFAFLASEGGGPTDSAPSVQPPAQFPTGWFTRREAALSWLRVTAA